MTHKGSLLEVAHIVSLARRKVGRIQGEVTEQKAVDHTVISRLFYSHPCTYDLILISCSHDTLDVQYDEACRDPRPARHEDTRPRSQHNTDKSSC